MTDRFQLDRCDRIKQVEYENLLVVAAALAVVARLITDQSFEVQNAIRNKRKATEERITQIRNKNGNEINRLE